MLRVHVDDSGKPVRLVELFVDRRYYDEAPKRFNKEMVLAMLQELHGADLEQIRNSFTLTIADKFIASQLAIGAGDSIGRLRRVMTNKAGEAVYFAVAWIRPERIALAWTSKRPDND
jgi:DNA-binding GntR family transcriptional regulator